MSVPMTLKGRTQGTNFLWRISIRTLLPFDLKPYDQSWHGNMRGVFLAGQSERTSDFFWKLLHTPTPYDTQLIRSFVAVIKFVVVRELFPNVKFVEKFVSLSGVLACRPTIPSTDGRIA